MVGGEPRESLVEPVAGGGAGRLHVPVAVPHAEEAQLLLHLLRLHRCKMKGPENGLVTSLACLSRTFGVGQNKDRDHQKSYMSMQIMKGNNGVQRQGGKGKGKIITEGATEQPIEGRPRHVI